MDHLFTCNANYVAVMIIIGIAVGVIMTLITIALTKINKQGKD